MAEEQEEPKVEKTERQLKTEERDRLVQERENAQKAMKAEYRKIAGIPALVDMSKKLRTLADYHAKLAKDGVGYEKNADGSPGQMVRMSPDQRLTELDKAAGLEEMVDYLTRMLTIEPVKTAKKDKKDE